jgi:hypothetical protein
VNKCDYDDDNDDDDAVSHKIPKSTSLDHGASLISLNAMIS